MNHTEENIKDWHFSEHKGEMSNESLKTDSRMCPMYCLRNQCKMESITLFLTFK